MSSLRVFILIGITAMLIVGCSSGGSGEPTIMGQPAEIATLQAETAAVTELATQTLDPVLPTATTSEIAAPTLPPMGQEMLGAFPMSLGASWTYNLVLDYDSQTGLQHFEGEITETVVEATPHIEAWVFRTHITGHPMMPDLATSGYYYTMIGSGLYRFEQFEAENAADATNPQQTPTYASRQILAWPLELNQMFGDPALMNEEGRNVWKVGSDNVSIGVPAGQFEGCYIVSMLTNPDDAHRWFCPGTGVVMYEYHHHGSIHDEIWTLVSFTPGS